MVTRRSRSRRESSWRSIAFTPRRSRWFSPAATRSRDGAFWNRRHAPLEGRRRCPNACRVVPGPRVERADGLLPGRRRHESLSGVGDSALEDHRGESDAFHPGLQAAGDGVLPAGFLSVGLASSRLSHGGLSIDDGEHRIAVSGCEASNWLDRDWRSGGTSRFLSSTPHGCVSQRRRHLRYLVRHVLSACAVSLFKETAGAVSDLLPAGSELQGNGREPSVDRTRLRLDLPPANRNGRFLAGALPHSDRVYR